MLKSVLFTHDDLDGAGCRIVYELKCLSEGMVKGADYEVFNCSNSNIDTIVIDNTINRDDLINHDTEILFGDICCNDDTLEMLIVKDYNVNVYDHHQSNLKLYGIMNHNKCHVHIDTNGIMESGTSLMYKMMCRDNINTMMINRLDEFVNLIRAYDTYEWKDTGNIFARKLQVLFIMLGMNQFCNEYIDKFINNTIKVIIDDSDMRFINNKLNMENAAIDKFIQNDQVIPITINEYKMAMIIGNYGINFSELASRFLDYHGNKYDVVCLFDIFNGVGTFSFRSKSNKVNVANIFAVPMGGGGHAKAAGATMHASEFNDVIDYITKYVFKYVKHN